MLEIPLVSKVKFVIVEILGTLITVYVMYISKRMRFYAAFLRCIWLQNSFGECGILSSTTNVRIYFLIPLTEKDIIFSKIVFESLPILQCIS